MNIDDPTTDIRSERELRIIALQAAVDQTAGRQIAALQILNMAYVFFTWLNKEPVE